jgi:hypothetical protein
VRGVQAGRFDVLGARAVLANLATVGALICLLGVTPKARADAAEPAVRAEVQAVVSRDLGRVSGRVRLTVQAPPGQALAHIDLWAFPERLATPPPEMDEVDEPRVFPVGFRPAGLTLDRAVDPLGNSLRVERIEGTVYRVWLATPAEAGTRAVVEVDFDTQVPRRFGPFGRDAGQLTLDGGWFPRPPPLGVDGFQSDLPPDEIDYSVRLQWQGERRSLAVVNGELADVPAGGDAVRVGSGVARRVALVLYTQHQISRLSTDYGRVMLIHRRQRRGMRGADGLADLAAIDVHAQTLGTVGAALGFLARQGLRARGVTVCAEAPLRRELARTAPGMLLVSDRAFDVTPFERVRKFHRLPLVRATAALVVEPRVAAAAPRGRADQVVDLVATELTEAWERDQYGTQEGARELLTKGNFVAEVDDALTAPQIPFESAFFRGPDDTDRFRDTFELFSHRRPVGRLWLEKLVDRLGRDAAHAIARAVAEGESLPAALARLGDGVDLAWLAAWDQGTPERNFAVGEVTPGGDEAGPYVDVVVRTEGPASPPEHLIVRVEGGTDGPVEAPVLVDAERVTARVRTDARRPRVTLDPKRRLAESDLGRPVDPRADNLTHRGWRVLLDGLGLSLNSASGRADTVITGFVRREADIANSIFLAVFDLERRTGAAMDWVHGLGPKVAPNRRRFGVGVGGSVSWLKPRAGGGSGVGVRFRLGFFGPHLPQPHGSSVGRDTELVGRADLGGSGRHHGHRVLRQWPPGEVGPRGRPPHARGRAPCGCAARRDLVVGVAGYRRAGGCPSARDLCPRRRAPARGIAGVAPSSDPERVALGAPARLCPWGRRRALRRRGALGPDAPRAGPRSSGVARRGLRVSLPLRHRRGDPHGLLDRWRGALAGRRGLAPRSHPCDRDRGRRTVVLRPSAGRGPLREGSRRSFATGRPWPI